MPPRDPPCCEEQDERDAGLPALARQWAARQFTEMQKKFPTAEDKENRTGGDWLWSSRIERSSVCVKEHLRMPTDRSGGEGGAGAGGGGEGEPGAPRHGDETLVITEHPPNIGAT